MGPCRNEAQGLSLPPAIPKALLIHNADAIRASVGSYVHVQAWGQVFHYHIHRQSPKHR